MEPYLTDASGNSYNIRVLCSILNVPYEKVYVDWPSREHKRAPFIRLNPRGQVPVMEIEGKVFWDSTAHLVYIARKYGGEQWLPTEPLAMAEVAQWLAFAQNEIHFEADIPLPTVIEQIESVTREARLPSSLAAETESEPGRKYPVLFRRDAGLVRLTLYDAGHDFDIGPEGGEGYCAIGGTVDSLQAYLAANYRAGLSLRDALRLGRDTLQRAEKGQPDLGPEKLEVAILDRARSGRRFRRLLPDEVREHLSR